MTNESLEPKSLFKLQDISSQGDGMYSIRLTRDGQTITAECVVKHLDESKIVPFDIVQFKSDEFNKLCAHGDIYLKPISKVILAFHECLYGKLG